MIVGITGHQVIGDAATVDWVRRELENQLRGLDVTLGLSSLAVGADQLFVDALRSLHLPYEAVIPCARYEEAFVNESARSEYRKCLLSASRIHRLPYEQPSDEAFLAAGKWIVGHCNLLLAVWDGKPARGFGGTADVIKMTVNFRRIWIHINPRQRLIRRSI